MANPTKLKKDVISELQNRLYYNQLDVERLINNPALYSHKDVVNRITHLLEKNVVASASIELLEQYLPTAKPEQAEQVPQEPSAPAGGEATLKPE